MENLAVALKLAFLSSGEANEARRALDAMPCRPDSLTEDDTPM